MNDTQIQLDTATRTKRIDEPQKSIYTDLQSYAAQVLIDKLLQFDVAGEDQLNSLKKRQDRVRYMHDFLRAMNKDAKGAGDMINMDKNEELKKFVEQAKGFGKEADELEHKALILERDANLKKVQAEMQGNRPDLIEIAEKEIKQAQGIRQEVAELRDMSKTINNLVDDKGNIKKKLSKEERGRIVENINTVIDDFNTLNQMDFHKVNQLNQDRQSLQLMVKDMIKKLGDIVLQMARGVRGS